MVRERGEREVWVGHHTGIFKIRLGVGEIEGRDRETEIQRYRKIDLTIKIPRKAW
jgi:hypothetical protein